MTQKPQVFSSWNKTKYFYLLVVRSLFAMFQDAVWTSSDGNSNGALEFPDFDISNTPIPINRGRSNKSDGGDK